MTSRMSGAARAGGLRASDDTVARAVRRILTFDERFVGLEPSASLSLRERALLGALGDVSVQAGPAPAMTEGPVCHIGIHDHGRLYLSLDRPDARGLHASAWAALAATDVQRVADARADLDPVRAAADAEMDGFMGALGALALAAVV